MENDDEYFSKKCVSCEVGFPKAELHEPFEDIFYCEECMEKYKLPMKSKPEPIGWDYN